MLTTEKTALRNVLIGACTISFSSVFIRLSGSDPDTAGFYRTLFGAVAILIFLLAVRKPHGITRKGLTMLLVASLFLAVDFMFWHRSIGLIGPGLATLLANLQVFITPLLTLLLFRQKIQGRTMLAAAIASIGLFLIAGKGWGSLSDGYKTGFIFSLATAVTYAAYIAILQRAMSSTGITDSRAAMFVVCLGCVGFFGVQIPLSGGTFQIPHLQGVLSLMGVGLFSHSVGWVLIASGMKFLSASAASLILLMPPSLAYVWDVLLFGKKPGLFEVVGVIIVIGSIYFGTPKESEKR